MSWHLSHQFTTLHRAVSVALSCSVGMICLPAAHAATLGQLHVVSKQFEPLNARIEVSDIDAASFDARIASSSLYQQMGLTQAATMTVRFVPASATSGQLLIQTAQPISTPFADVVLNVVDKGQRQVIPKTLLMPLSDSVAIPSSNQAQTISPSRTITPDRPTAANLSATPLAVKRGAPPPLFDTPKPTSPNKSSAAPRAQPLSAVSAATMPTLPMTTPAATMRPPAKTPLSTDQTAALYKDALKEPAAPISARQATPAALQSESSSSDYDVKANNPMPASSQVDRQYGILNIQVTRQIKAPPRPTDALIINPPIDNISASDINADYDDPSTTSQGKNADITTQDNNKALAGRAQDAALDQNDQKPLAGSADLVDQESNSLSTTVSYRVQKNDNLWVIAEQLAKKNHLDIQTVMRQIQTQNPDAFIHADANRLKTDVTLELPNYDVVPSQQSLQAAITAQRQYYAKANAAKSNLSENDSKAAMTPSAANRASALDSKTADEGVVTASTTDSLKKSTQTLPQAQFSVVAPHQKGRADGTQSKGESTTKKGNGLSDNTVALLQAARARTAEQAERVKSAQSALARHTRTLQLQNQKLAELEARLKELRNQ